MKNKILYECGRETMPPSAQKLIDSYADRISAVDRGGGFSHPNTGRDCVAYNILLRKGWCVYDGDCHTIIEPTLTKVRYELANAAPCTCNECRGINTSSSTHGGARTGAGRKALDETGTVVTTLRLTPKQKTTLTMLGGAAWVRQQLDLLG